MSYEDFLKTYRILKKTSKGLSRAYRSLKEEYRDVHLAFRSLKRNEGLGIRPKHFGYLDGYKYVQTDQDMFISLKLSQ